MPPKRRAAQKRKATPAATKAADAEPEESPTLAAKVAKGKAAAKAKSKPKAKPGPKVGKGKTGKTKAKTNLEENDKGATSDTKQTAAAKPKASSAKSDERLPFSFYDKDCADLAKDLLGKRLVRKTGADRVSGIIVETEAYLGGEDKAAHSHKGKTNKNAAMYMPPGTGYVYHIYGVYTCMNISSRGDGAAVLLRGLDATEGQDLMRPLRGAKKADKGASLKNHELGNGPSKLTQALAIKRPDVDQQDLTTLEHTWVEDGIDVAAEDIIVSSRVGVDYAGDWAKKPLRFYVRGNKGVSVRDKAAEWQAENSVGDKGQ